MQKKVIPDTSDTTGQYPKPENDACMDAEPTRYTQTISPDYQASGGIREGHESSDHYYGRDTNVTYVPYALSDLNKKYIRDTHKVTDHITIENEKGDAHTRQAALISSQTDLSAYTAAYQLRLTVTNNNPASAFDIAQKLQGTKAYGVKSDSEPDELISNSDPVLVASQYGDTYTSDKYIEIPQGAAYTSIRFEYPAAACFTGQSEIHELSDSVYTDIVSTIRTNTHDALITLLASKSDPIVSSNNEYGTSTIAYTFVHKTGEAAKTDVVSPAKEYTYIKDDFKLKYDDIVRAREVNVTNGTEFFSDDIVKTQVSYKQQKHGDSNAVKPYNPTIYYLVPDGLEPNQIGANANPMWSSIGVQRNYKPGYNLVIAKQKSY